jgi:hypothetical protein
MKQPPINRVLPVKKKTLLTAAFISPPFFMVKAEAGIVNFAQANPRASETSYFTIDAPEPSQQERCRRSCWFCRRLSRRLLREIQEEDGKIMKRTTLEAGLKGAS